MFSEKHRRTVLVWTYRFPLKQLKRAIAFSLVHKAPFLKTGPLDKLCQEINKKCKQSF